MEQKEYAVLSEKISNIEERITELAGNHQALTKSYYVLNECHHKLELGFTRMETEWRTTKAWIKWLIGGSALSLLLNLVALVTIIRG